ncbi:thaumatin-like protein 1a [Humulus lupulus]|uniref:thaumatin-like protein 1a n=1 Tax=Humulus lupulus TaxID=3486 RepID=UPI002B40DFD7|nr:thaumatin-like protein 1a [Humulus lupulus]
MAFTTSFTILISLPLLLLLQFLSGTHSTTFTVINNCNYNVWPAILSNSGSPPISLTGFALSPSDSEAIPVPPNWSGRLWGRTHCAADINGKFTCLTGDCGSSAVECGGGNLSPPATTVEFTLTDDGTVNYLISVADGYNLPLMVVPQGGTAGPGNCGTVGCVMDSNSEYIPKELRVTSSTGTGNESTVAIKSACGGASGPGNCNPNSNSELFKKWCPQAQASAYDKSSSSTCQSSDFVFHFCPSGFPATRSNNGDNMGGGQGASSDDLGKDTSSTFGIVIGVVAGVIGLVLLIWLWRRYLKSGCEFHPCTCTCCGLFSCTICGDD